MVGGPACEFELRRRQNYRHTVNELGSKQISARAIHVWVRPHLLPKEAFMRACSLDLRERVVRAVDRGGQTQPQIAERFGVGTTWIKKLLGQRRETGSIAPKPHGGGMPAKYRGKALTRLKKALAAHPDATLEELRDRTGVKASLMAVSRALERLKARRKKRFFSQNRGVTHDGRILPLNTGRVIHWQYTAYDSPNALLPHERYPCWPPAISHRSEASSKAVEPCGQARTGSCVVFSPLVSVPGIGRRTKKRRSGRPSKIVQT